MKNSNNNIVTNDHISNPSDLATNAGIILTRMAVSAVPLVSGPALELFNSLLRTVPERQAQAVIDDIRHWLELVENNGGCPNLQTVTAQPRFESALFRAIELSVKNYEAAKLTVLRNAVVHTAIDPSLDGHLWDLFWRWVAELGTLHVLALDFFSRPQPYKTPNDPTIPPHSPGSMVDMALLSLPKFGNRIDISQVIISDLVERRLLKDDGAMLFVDLDNNRNMRPMISELGQQFLSFVSEPKISADGDGKI